MSINNKLDEIEKAFTVIDPLAMWPDTAKALYAPTLLSALRRANETLEQLSGLFGLIIPASQQGIIKYPEGIIDYQASLCREAGRVEDTLADVQKILNKGE